MKVQIPLLITLTLAATSSALGINCRGSFQCIFLTDSPLDTVVGFIDQIDESRFYQNGEHIACTGFICAFLQNSGGAPGSSIKTLAHNLLDHGCHQCGSVPLFFPQDNDVANGQLTINAAEEFKCPASPDDEGLC